MHVDAGVVIAAAAVVVASVITTSGTLFVGWLNHRSLRDQGRRVDEIHERTDTRNGKTLGEAMSEVYDRLRTVEDDVGEVKDNELDLLDGMAWLGGQFVRLEGRLSRRRRREEQPPPEGGS